MTHLSRLAEELILWSSSEFNMIRLQNEFTSGSSIMPQKRNPDVAEIIRGETGRIYGNLVALLTILKGLPLSYNRDLQEDKPAFFDTVDTLQGCLAVAGPMIATMVVRAERMRALCDRGFLAATELADYLTEKGVPFRSAHGVVKRVVAYCETQRIRLDELTLEELQRFDDAFDAGALKRLSIDQVVHVKDSEGVNVAAPRPAANRSTQAAGALRFRRLFSFLRGAARFLSGACRVDATSAAGTRPDARRQRPSGHQKFPGASHARTKTSNIALQRVRESESLVLPKKDFNANWSKFRVQGDKPLLLEPALGPNVDPESARRKIFIPRGPTSIRRSMKAAVCVTPGARRAFPMNARSSTNEAVQNQVDQPGETGFLRSAAGPGKDRQYDDSLERLRALIKTDACARIETIARGK